MRPKFLIILFIIITNYIFSFGQSIMRGRISDENGEPLTGATVAVKSGAIGAMTDFDGNYSLKLTGNEPVTIKVSFIGYNTIEEEIDPKEKVIVRNYILPVATEEIEQVNIYYRAKRDNELTMIAFRQNSALSLDYISKETIKKTGDSQLDDALKRVTGVSMASGYLTVRGLGDRYIKTSINGSVIPTLDPMKNNIKLDMFPTALIDNVVINKTLSPDLPGDWSGSYVSVETKNYPEKLMVSIKSSFGYNQNSSFTDIVTSKRSKTDWLGFDNGLRDIAHYSKDDFPTYVRNTNPHDEFSQLGLENYLDDKGIEPEHISQPTDYRRHMYDNNLYYRMCLVELGLLPAALINNEDAVFAATEVYDENPEYKNRAHLLVNAGHISFAKQVPDNWLTTTRRTSLDYSQDISIGNQVLLFGKPFGFIAGLRYSSSVRYDPGSVSGIYTVRYAADGLWDTSYIFTRQISKETHQASGLINVSYNVSPNHSVSLLFLPNFTGINTCSYDTSIFSYSANAEQFNRHYIHNQFYEERQHKIYQYESKHFFPGIKLKMELKASYTAGQNDVPGFSKVNYYRLNNHFKVKSGDDDMDTRYRYLVDNVLDVQYSAEIPVKSKPGLARKIKTGISYLANTREYKQYTYTVLGADPAREFSSLDEFSDYKSKDTYERIDYSIANGDTVNNHKIEHYIDPKIYDSEFNRGYNKILAGFLMLDYSINKSLRVSGGIRIENTNLYNDMSKLFDKNIPAGDSLRFIGTVGKISNFFFNPSKRKETNILPSVNLIYKIVQNETMAINARLGYGKSLGRYSLREVSSSTEYNFDLGHYVTGNPDLKPVYIDNYDLRFESFFAGGDNLSLSGFYKTFENHIELEIVSNGYTWINSPFKSKAYGIELEGKKKLFSNLEIMGNVTFVHSYSSAIIYFGGAATNIGASYYDTLNRAMFGQAPYIINGILSYKWEKPGITAAVSYNVQGPKLIFVTTQGEQPDIIEMPRHMLDLKVSKQLGRHFNIEVKIRDVLNTKDSWKYDYNNFEKEFKGINYGPSYTVGISYDL